MGTIKGRNDKNLTYTEKIKKKWQEYRELYKKDPNEPDYHDGVVIHLQLDILKCEVKQALGSITNNKVSAGDGIPAELFQIPKDYAVRLQLIKINEKKNASPYMPRNLENSWVATGLKKLSVIPFTNNNAKESSNVHTIALIAHC